MPLYHCECCDFVTHIKTHYTTHLNTNKHNTNYEKHHNAQRRINLTINEYSKDNKKKIDKRKNTKYECKYCYKVYKYSQGLSKHIKYTCKKSNDEDLKELARLLNRTKEEINETKEEMTEIIKNKDWQLDKMQKQIDKLTNKLQIKNIVNGDIINNNTIYNIQLLNYSSTDYSHLTEFDYMDCINDCNHCVMTLIERVHFNKNKPENMNIYISSIKGNYVMVYKDNAWQIQNKKEQINDLYDYNEVLLENWYDEYKEKYPDIIQSFQRYLKNRDDNTVINEVKHEILKMLYNNRKMIQE
jgi:hypothetical protein|tara:strand:+ start:28 stop:924 length:897 start_codon:yes stop_codon:yes gene_type:complete